MGGAVVVDSEVGAAVVVVEVDAEGAVAVGGAVETSPP